MHTVADLSQSERISPTREAHPTRSRSRLTAGSGSRGRDHALCHDLLRGYQATGLHGYRNRRIELRQYAGGSLSHILFDVRPHAFVDEPHGLARRRGMAGKGRAGVWPKNPAQAGGLGCGGPWQDPRVLASGISVRFAFRTGTPTTGA